MRVSPILQGRPHVGCRRPATITPCFFFVGLLFCLVYLLGNFLFLTDVFVLSLKKREKERKRKNRVGWEGRLGGPGRSLGRGKT